MSKSSDTERTARDQTFLDAVKSAATLELTPVDSSNIRAIGYDPLLAVLFVSFHSGDRPYAYFNVTSNAWDELRDADSKGSAFHRIIKSAGYQWAVMPPCTGTLQQLLQGLNRPAKLWHPTYGEVFLDDDRWELQANE